MRWFDVHDQSEAGAAAPGTRHLDFYGGSKNYRIFEVPVDTTRTEFMDANRGELDPSLVPAYHHRGVRVTQDPTWPVPGFYVISADQRYPSIDSMPTTLHLRMALALQATRAAMRNALGVRTVYTYNQEKWKVSPAEVHTWLLPIYPGVVEGTSLTSSVRSRAFDLSMYLRSFTFKDNENALREARDQVAEYFVKYELMAQDDRLIRALEGVVSVNAPTPRATLLPELG